MGRRELVDVGVCCHDGHAKICRCGQNGKFPADIRLAHNDYFRMRDDGFYKDFHRPFALTRHNIFFKIGSFARAPFRGNADPAVFFGSDDLQGLFDHDAPDAAASYPADHFSRLQDQGLVPYFPGTGGYAVDYLGNGEVGPTGQVLFYVQYKFVKHSSAIFPISINCRDYGPIQRHPGVALHLPSLSGSADNLSYPSGGLARSGSCISAGWYRQLL